MGVLRLADRRAERQTQQVGHKRRTETNQNLADTALERRSTRQQTHHAAGEAQSRTHKQQGQHYREHARETENIGQNRNQCTRGKERERRSGGTNIGTLSHVLLAVLILAVRQ